MATLTLAYDAYGDGSFAPEPGARPVPWAPPCMKIRADALVAGDVIGLYPLPLTPAKVTREWRADDDLITTDQGAWEAMPGAGITLLAVSGQPEPSSPHSPWR